MEQIDVLKALLRDMKDGIHNHSWPAHQEAVQDQATAEVLDDVRLPGAQMGGVRHLTPGYSCHFLYQLGTN